MYTHIYIHTRWLAWSRAEQHTYTYISIHTHTYTYTHIHTHTYTYIHIHIHTHKYTYIHIHTHTQAGRNRTPEGGDSENEDADI